LTAFDFTLDLLLRNNKAEVLADSRLTTINGRPANIKLVDIVPYILSSGGVGGQVQVQKEEVGIKLDVLPTVNTDGYITVKVEPEVSTIFEFIGPDANIPRVKKRASSSTIRVRDGESIIIGGLLSNDKKQTTYKFPLLHKLPYIGEKIFTSRSVIERKTDLVIQITPKIIQDAYTGIEKSKEVADYEKYVIDRQYNGRNIQNSNPVNEVEPQFKEEGE
jgi:type II secretory pathway component GspD/PulD (secretin)